LFAVLGCAVGVTSLFACSDRSESPDVEGASGAVNTDEKDIFAKVDPFEVKISAPLSKLFARYKAGEADPPSADAGAAPQEREFSEAGQLVFANGRETKTLDLRLFIRGESSKYDCPFTKLKIDFADKEQLKKTPFKGHGKMRLNTHCGPGDASARSGMGRVFNGVGPVREELTYRLIRAAGIPTYGTRVVAVHYDDTADKTQLETFGMLVESGDDAAQRFAKMEPPLVAEGAEYLDPNVARSLKITPENTAQIVVAEAIAGNADWFGTHNIDSFGVLPVTTGFQIAQDFDLGAIAQGDIAKYRVAQISAAKAGLANATVAESIRAHKGAVDAAYAEAEKAMIAAKAIPSVDGKTTTDSGFLEAKKRLAELFSYPELSGAPPAVDAGTDAAADH
jgi:hypothetical protein